MKGPRSAAWTAALAAAAVLAAPRGRASPPPGAPAPDPLDQLLLEDAAEAPAPTGPSNGASDQPGGGAARPAAPDPLAAVSLAMVAAGRRLNEPEGLAEALRLQQQAIQQLDQLLASLEQNSRPAGRPEQRQGGAQRGEQPRPSQAPLQAGREAAGQAAETAGRPPGGSAADPAELARQAADRVWGQLPPQLRQQLQQITPEQFLPQYESLLEAYYLRLAAP